MMRFALALLVLVSATRLARADEVAYTCFAAPNVKPITADGACVGFEARDAAGKLVQRVDKGYRISGTILATPDGMTVAMLQTFPYATGKLDTMDALIFFRGGKPIARYTMAQLIERMQLVTRSVSHYQWLARDVDIKLVLGKTLVIETASMRHHEFDVATGKQLSADDTATWKQCDVLVYLTERLGPSKSGIYQLAKPWIAKGPAFASGLAFRAAKGVGVEDRSGITLCLEPSTAGWVATRTLDVMYNQLPH
ncbi:MAG TPA: hypothetical protein VFQ53_32670 [Kofleriaceae bacterium]|nr:hypothetical protein [Kofleriaceae bacterium]